MRAKTNVRLRSWALAFVVVLGGSCGDQDPTTGPGGSGGTAGGGGGGGATTGLSAPILSIAVGGIKTLDLSWTAVDGATFYRAAFDPHGNSDFAQIGAELPAAQTVLSVEVPVHLLDWASARYRVQACDELGCSASEPIGIFEFMVDSIGYFKASNAWAGDWFGTVALSSDGKTMAVGARLEDSAAPGVNGDQNDESARWAGAVYVFVESDGLWQQEAYLKASNPGVEDRFGEHVAISADGNAIVVGARFEDSDGDPQDDSVMDSGAAYVFRREAGAWAQEGYLKSLSNESGGGFWRVAIDASGNRVAVGAAGARATAGLVEIFDRVDTEGAVAWSRAEVLTPGRTVEGDRFGAALSFGEGGETLAIGAPGDESSSLELDNDAPDSGAVYIFTRTGGDWEQGAFVKASTVGIGDGFGVAVSLSADGTTLAVGATSESSASGGVHADPSDDSAERAGAAYVFGRDADDWVQEAYIKAPNPVADDAFADAITLSDDGSLLVAAMRSEGSSAVGVGGDQNDESLDNAGAVYVYARDDSGWGFVNYVKAPNTGDGDVFGAYISLSGDGSRLAVGAVYEDSDATGIGGDQGDAQPPGDLTRFGAVYLY